MTTRGSSGPVLTARYAPIGEYGVVEHGARRAAAPGASCVLGERELGRDDFVHGKFGENFTLDGLPDDDKDRAVLLLSDP